jgi:hypothetical protein
MHGTKVDTNADIDEGPPRWPPARADVLGSDMLSDTVFRNIAFWICDLQQHRLKDCIHLCSFASWSATTVIAPSPSIPPTMTMMGLLARRSSFQSGSS